MPVDMDPAALRDAPALGRAGRAEGRLRRRWPAAVAAAVPDSARRRIRITHIITGLQTGGAEHALEQLVTRADRDRFEMRVVSLLGAGVVGERLAGSGVEVVSLGMRREPADLLRFWQLVRQLRRDRPDIVQTWLYHADLIGLAAARLAGVPSVLWNVRGSGLEHHHYRDRFRWVVAALARLSALPDAVVANAEAGRDFHARAGYQPRHWALIDNAVDIARFHPDPAAAPALRAELGLAPDAPVIGMTARCDPMKDHSTFFRAAALLAGSGVAADFVLIGRGSARSMPAALPYLADPLLASRLHFLGERDDVERLTAGFDLATLSSAFGEGFPNVIAEAMACAVPVVSTDVGDARRILGTAGVLVPPRDPAALAAAWRDLLAAPSRRAAMGRAGRQRIAETFGLDRMIDRYGQLYEQVRTGRRSV